MNQKVVVLKSGTLTAKDKERLTKQGVCYIEVSFPNDVRVLDLSPEAPMKEILLAAFAGLDNANLMDRSVAWSKLSEFLSK